MGIDFKHIEDNYTDFNREKLIPYQVSDRGPALAIGDLNDDGKEDVFFGGSKLISSQIYLNQDSSFVQSTYKSIEDELIKEDVAAAIADFNGDSKNDILIGSGGADFYGEANPLLDSYFIQNDATYVKAELPNYFQNASVIKPYDFDNDGDLDVFVGGHTVSGKFGIPATSYLLQNDEGTFSILKNFEASDQGMICLLYTSDAADE